MKPEDTPSIGIIASCLYPHSNILTAIARITSHLEPARKAFGYP